MTLGIMLKRAMRLLLGNIINDQVEGTHRMCLLGTKVQLSYILIWFVLPSFL